MDQYGNFVFAILMDPFGYSSAVLLTMTHLHSSRYQFNGSLDRKKAQHRFNGRRKQWKPCVPHRGSWRNLILGFNVTEIKYV